MSNENHFSAEEEGKGHSEITNQEQNPSTGIFLEKS